MVALLSNLIRLLTAYVRHRTETDLDQRIAASRRQLRDMAEEINTLRTKAAAGDDSHDATQRADWLFGEYRGEAKHLAYLRAQRLEAARRRGSADH